MLSRAQVATARGMAVAAAYEMARGATLTDVSGGRDLRLWQAFETIGAHPPQVPSADFISLLGDELRIVEVKVRGSSGPVEIVGRQLATFVAGTASTWLYVVFNTTQRGPYELWLVQDPARLAWRQTLAASFRDPQFQGVSHDSKHVCEAEEIRDFGSTADLTGLALPPKPEYDRTELGAGQ